MSEPLLELRNLSVAFDTERGQIRPVRDVSLSIFPGQTVAVVGESGCGKSVTAMSILRLIPSPPGKVLAGEVRFNGRDLLSLSEREMRSVRGKDIAMIFQEPMTSLNPVYTIGDQIVEAITLHQGVGTTKAYQIAEESLRDVGIADPHRRLQAYPHEMSGGMRQRVMIAMALSCQLLNSSLPTNRRRQPGCHDSVQILELLRNLQRERNMAIMLITHDLGVVAENADVVAVMYASRIVECATVEDLFDKPQHPYTEGLFRSIPEAQALTQSIGLIRFVERVPLIPRVSPRDANSIPAARAGRELAQQHPPPDQTVQLADDAMKPFPHSQAVQGRRTAMSKKFSRSTGRRVIRFRTGTTPPR